MTTAKSKLRVYPTVAFYRIFLSLASFAPHPLMKLGQALVFVLALPVLAQIGQAAEQPNVVVILADDLGYGDLGCYGQKVFETPRIDKMAAEGARLTQFNTPLPYCAPTRASLLTGRYPVRCGMSLNPTPDSGPKADKLALPAQELTLANLLKKNGYATSLIGKWHLGHYAGSLPTDRGFDEYFGIPYSNDMRPVKLLENTTQFEYPVVQTNLTSRYTDRAVDFIQRNRERPFFLYFAQVMPHKPLAASEKNYKKSGHGLYADVIADLDESVGRVLDAIKENGLDEKTLIVFSSDNGPWFGGSTGGLRGMKGSTYEGGVRVPLLARWPGKIPAGQVNHQLSVMMDVFATVAEITGVDLPNDRIFDGRSLMPILTTDATFENRITFIQKDTRLSAVRDQRWKLHVLAPGIPNLKADANNRWTDFRAPDGVTILAPFEQYNLDAFPGVSTGDVTGEMQLFDLENDPSEQRNIASQHPEIVKRLKMAFDEHHRLFDASPQ
jgi:arylsulfatase A-like enzyme